MDDRDIFNIVIFFFFDLPIFKALNWTHYKWDNVDRTRLFMCA